VADITQLSPHAVDIPAPEVYEAEVNEDATEVGQEVRCVVESLDPLLASDPMAWMPFVTHKGVFYPKKGDRAKVSGGTDGPEAILAWWPNAKEPDVAF
jgi:hypothetical protein